MHDEFDFPPPFLRVLFVRVTAGRNSGSARAASSDATQPDPRVPCPGWRDVPRAEHGSCQIIPSRDGIAKIFRHLNGLVRAAYLAYASAQVGSALNTRCFILTRFDSLPVNQRATPRAFSPLYSTTLPCYVLRSHPGLRVRLALP